LQEKALGKYRHTIESRLSDLGQEVQALSDRIARLETLLHARPFVEPLPAVSARARPPEDSQAAADSWATRGGMTGILSRIAAVSMILVVALVLRTVTDNGLIGLTLGSVLGIAYASLLGGVGCIMYWRAHAFAPVFTVSGAVLFFAVVLETHARFEAISAPIAYALLALAGAGLTAVSRWRRVAVPVCVGTLGLVLAGVPMDFPNPQFHYLALFVLAVNVMAFSTVAVPRCRWIRVPCFGAAAFVWTAWAMKIRFALRTGSLSPAQVQADWFLPTLTVLTLFYLAYVFLRARRKETAGVTPFDAFLPSAVTALAYGLAHLVLSALGDGVGMLGAAGSVLATLLLGAGMLLARRRPLGASGPTLFVFPAAFLLAVSFRDLSGQSIAALAVLSWAALSLFYMSRLWHDGGVRVTSYLLQLTVLGAASVLLARSPSGSAAWVTLPSLAVMAAVAFVHYRFARKTPPPADSALHNRVDRRDLSAVVLLVASLGAAFLMFRAGLFELLMDSGRSFDSAYRCGQSMVMSLAAMGLFLAAHRGRNLEIVVLAILVTAAAALKATAFDLLGTRGLPLVLSFLSLAAAAAAGSIVLGRWSRLKPRRIS